MRRWTVFVAALTILIMFFQAGPVLAKSETSDKKSDKQVHSSSKSSSQSASSSKSSGKEEKKHSSSKESSKKHASKHEGKVSKETAKESPKAKKRQAAEAPARIAPVPDSYRGEFGVDTKAAMAMDIESSKVLFAQEADQPIPPASLTKVLTLYLIQERLKAGTLRLDEVVPVSQDASHAGGSTMRLKTGESVTVEELIKGIAVASANDGCVAIAQYLGKGDIAPFVEEMNRKAKELGMTNSHFFNPNGLPAEGQVTTARDMATLAQAYLTKFPETLSIHSMTEFTHNNRVRHNSNSLLGKVEGVDGLKTGFVCASGFNIVVTARRGDTRLVAVVLGAKNRRVREREATRLVEEGFKIVAAEKGQSGKHVAMNH